MSPFLKQQAIPRSTPWAGSLVQFFSPGLTGTSESVTVKLFTLTVFLFSDFTSYKYLTPSTGSVVVESY